MIWQRNIYAVIFKSSILKEKRPTVSPQCHAGANGDKDRKRRAAAKGPGNAAGAKVPYATKLLDFPSIPLLCSNPDCKKDWRYFDGVKKNNGGEPGKPQGIVEKEARTVFIRQERHWACGNVRCKPVNGTAVTIEGAIYNVTSGSDSKFRTKIRL